MAEGASLLGAELGEALDRERRLIRSYRQHLLSASSPRVRHVFEVGLALKRQHETELERWFSASGRPSAEEIGVVVLPGPREMLTWYYEEEQALALHYRDLLRLTDAPDVYRVVDRLRSDQLDHCVRLKSLYRGFSAA